jgi:hypothetical protein
MICIDCISYLWMLDWRWSDKTKTCCHNKILIFIHCCVIIVSLQHSVLFSRINGWHNFEVLITIHCCTGILTVSLKQFVLVLELMQNRMPSIKTFLPMCSQKKFCTSVEQRTKLLFCCYLIVLSSFRTRPIFYCCLCEERDTTFQKIYLFLSWVTWSRCVYTAIWIKN